MAGITTEQGPFRSFHYANPNRDRVIDSHALTGRQVAPEEDTQVRSKEPGVREVPRLRHLLRVANGVNSGSAIIARGVYFGIRPSSD